LQPQQLLKVSFKFGWHGFAAEQTSQPLFPASGAQRQRYAGLFLILSPFTPVEGVIRDGIFKLLRSTGIDSMEPIRPAYVAWRAGTITLFLPGS
jgi:hypothetical protein